MNPALALLPVVILLAAGLFAVLGAKALRLSPIVGFIAVGALLGPGGFGLTPLDDTTRLLADLGVVFLLFDIGLQFSVGEVRRTWRDMLVFGSLQMLLCGAALGVIAHLALGLSPLIAGVVGLAFAASSTAVVARLLAEQGSTTCPFGRSTVALLVFQDLFAILLLVVATALASAPGAPPADAILASAWAGAKTAAAFAVAILAGRFLLGPGFALLGRTRNEESFPAAALLLALAAATATGGLGLSLTLGAFLAGMSIAETAYRHLIQTEIRSFRILLMGLFFLVVGMMLDLSALLADAPLVLALTLGVVLTKTLVTGLAARASGWSWPGVVRVAPLTAQAAEFTFVILAAPLVARALPERLGGALIAAAALTLAISPAWAEAGRQLARRLAARKAPAATDPTPAAPANRPVVVFAMTPPGRLALDALAAHSIPAIALENDPERFAAAIADGYRPMFGDAADTRFVETVGAANARAVVIGKARFEVSAAMTPYLAARIPDLRRFVSVEDAADAERHRALGLAAHIPLAEPAGLELALDLLASLGVGPERVAAWAAEVRAKTARGGPPPPEPLRAAA